MVDFTCLELEDVIKNVLEENQTKEGSTDVLAAEVAQALLKESHFADGESGSHIQHISDIFLPLSGKNCYPSRPLYKEIAQKLFQWIESSSHPSEHLQRFDLLEQTKVDSLSKKDALEKVEELLHKLKNSWQIWNVEERKTQTEKILRTLDKRMLLDLLGVRHTVGSVDFFPPAVEELVNSFCKKHKPNSSLSVGARALSKHCHRDGTSMFWGVCTGREDAKNKHACTILYKIINDTAWINIHLLPHDMKVIEVRCSQGYGARWLHDGSEFRGFLEPQMVDGHSMKWRH